MADLEEAIGIARQAVEEGTGAAVVANCVTIYCARAEIG
jgi:hypothetical protein